MAQKLNPRNNEWNRKYNFMDEKSSGHLIEIKNGMAYFAWKFKEGTESYYKCEESVFEKCFLLEAETAPAQVLQPVDRHYMRYPVEMKVP